MLSVVVTSVAAAASAVLASVTAVVTGLASLANLFVDNFAAVQSVPPQVPHR